MKIFSENLPLIVVSRFDQPDELKLQGIFDSILANDIHIKLPAADSRLKTGEKIHIIFYLEKNEFEFEGVIHQLNSTTLVVPKPQFIKRRKLRESGRLEDLNLDALFTIWNQEGRFQGNIINLSSNGCRMTGPLKLTPDSIITMTFVIKVDDSTFKIITQAIIRWSKQYDDFHQDLFISGIQFSTLSKINIERIERFVLTAR